MALTKVKNIVSKISELVHSDGVKKAETTSEGISVTGGVKFPATQSASSDVNTLDDYEEGTFTPVIADAASGGNTGTAAAVAGKYIKIGGQVTVQIEIININTAGMTSGNELHINNLPFTGDGRFYTGTCILTDITFQNGHWLAPYMSGTIDHLKFADMATGTGFNTTKISHITSGVGDIRLMITYFV